MIKETDTFPCVEKAGKGIFYSLYKKELEQIACNVANGGLAPSILLHSCCGPCSSSVISRLANTFRVTVFYYNPNIDTDAEYARRAESQRKIIDAFNASKEAKFPVNYIEETYDNVPFYEAARGLENEKEGGARCEACFALRLKRVAKEAAQMRADYFCTTLTVSPMKNASIINRLGFEAGKTESVKWLWSDFKKEAGYSLSVSLSKEHNLYRQDYCGCAFSKRERLK